jgi:hypothetical protein
VIHLELYQKFKCQSILPIPLGKTLHFYQESRDLGLMKKKKHKLFSLDNTAWKHLLFSFVWDFL